MHSQSAHIYNKYNIYWLILLAHFISVGCAPFCNNLSQHLVYATAHVSIENMQIPTVVCSVTLQKQNAKKKKNCDTIIATKVQRSALF